MVKRFVLSGLLIVAAACGDDADEGSEKQADAAVSASSGSGGSSSSTGGSSGSSSSNSGSSGSGGTMSGSSGSGAGESGTDGGAAGNPGTAPTDGSQLARCEDDDDCADGLNCYEFGGYCSAACATDADCASLGSSYTCNSRGGMPGGGRPGGGMMGGDAAAPEPTGTCRIQCDGEMDTSCPAGMTCQSPGGFTGGGGPGGRPMGGDAGMTTGTFRCGYEPEDEEPEPPADGGMGNDEDPPGTAGAFQQCEDDDACADGLECTGGGRGGNGYCSQGCEEDTDCAMQPASGSAELTCSGGGGGPGGGGPGGGGGSCTLSCAEDGQTCPDGMTCMRGGCRYAAEDGPGGNGP
jgi:hypothetical protein